MELEPWYNFDMKKALKIFFIIIGLLIFIIVILILAAPPRYNGPSKEFIQRASCSQECRTQWTTQYPDGNDYNQCINICNEIYANAPRTIPIPSPLQSLFGIKP